jgi:hypothetical protein
MEREEAAVDDERVRGSRDRRERTSEGKSRSKRTNERGEAEIDIPCRIGNDIGRIYLLILSGRQVKTKKMAENKERRSTISS